MVLTNYVKLIPGVPTRMHFTDDYNINRVIQDKERPDHTKRINSLVFQVDELEGEFVSRTFSIMSQKLAAHFEAYIPDRRYRDYDFIITQMGDGFLKDWNIQVIKRPETE